MEILKNGSLLITAPQKGIGNSHLSDFTNIQCLDASSVKGVCFANHSAVNVMSNYTDTYTAKTFTANAGTDVITVSGASFAKGQAVTLSTTGTLPAGLAAATTYYVVTAGSSFKLATTLANAIAGTGIDITDTGSGTHSITGTELGRITKIVQNPASTDSSGNFKYYAIDSNGRVWVQYGNIWVHLPGNGTNIGHGLEIWKGYLFSFTSTKIEVYGPLSAVGNTAAWSTNWQTVASDTQFHPSIVASNDRVYFGAGNTIAELSENTGETFAPGTGGTFTFTASALALPSGIRTKCIAELGGDLAIGVWKGNDVNIYGADYKVADVYFWDKSSTLSFRRPVQLQENGVNQLISLGNRLYIVAGNEGRIYVSDGVSTELFTQIPDSLTQLQQSTNSLWFWPNAIMRHKGRICVGVSVNALSSTTISPLGVYSIDPYSGQIQVENILPSNNDGSSDSISIGALISISESDYYIGVYNDNSQTYKGGIAKVSSANNGYASKAFFETGLTPVGDENNKKTYTNLDLLLAKPLASDQSLLVYYRTYIGETYTLLGTYSYATYGAIVNKNLACYIPQVSQIQIKVIFENEYKTTSAEFVSLTINP